MLLPRVAGALLLPLLGCATPTAYGPDGPEGGYRELEFARDLFEVRFESERFARPLRSTPERGFALLRAAELARARGASLFCLEGVQSFRGRLHWPLDLSYVAYTVRTFDAPPPDREITEDPTEEPALYACYEPSATARRLRAAHGLSSEGEEP